MFCDFCICLYYLISMQAKTAQGVPRYDLVKTRFGKKYFAKAVKVEKDQSWMTVAGSLVIQVTFWNNKEVKTSKIFINICFSVLRLVQGPVWLFPYWMMSLLSDQSFPRSVRLRPSRTTRADYSSSLNTKRAHTLHLPTCLSSNFNLTIPFTMLLRCPSLEQYMVTGQDRDMPTYTLHCRIPTPKHCWSAGRSYGISEDRTL